VCRVTISDAVYKIGSVETSTPTPGIPVREFCVAVASAFTISELSPPLQWFWLGADGLAIRRHAAIRAGGSQ
jgi:hypothetical protein